MNLRAHEQNCGHADFQPEVQVQNIVKTLESLAEDSHGGSPTGERFEF